MKIILIRSDHDFPHQSDYRTVAEPDLSRTVRGCHVPEVKRTSCHVLRPQTTTLRIIDFFFEIALRCYIMSRVQKQLRGLSDDVAALLQDQYDVLRSLDLDDRFSEVALATEFWDRVSELDTIEEIAPNIKTKRRLGEMFTKLAEQGTEEVAKLSRILTAPTVNNLAA
jgi:hypothetical protein